ncbi:MAG TPA: Hsp20/alpha crystallin family protein [Phycisphaerae bacterium]|nr:Hsp20/alpha crystallin family protein [Phycisphaerae bacterium]HOI53773.1 Hsp20/alpha crystallin family protein [Phycisphaerae bacterium]
MNTNETSRTPAVPEEYFLPPVDVMETADELVLTADMPGVSPEQLDVTVEEGVLTLHGRVSAEEEPASRKTVQREFLTGDYYRQFRLPRDFSAEGINASLKSGVVTIRIARDERSKPRRIPVQVEPAEAERRIEDKSGR